MKSKFTLAKILVMLVVMLGSAFNIYAQELTSKDVTDLVKKNATAIGLSTADLQNLRISAAYVDKTSGMTLVYVQQTYKGVDILNSLQTLAFKNGKIVSVAGGRIKNIASLANSKDGKATVASDAAIRATAAHLQLTIPAVANPLRGMNAAKEIEYGNLGISSVNIKSKLMWVTDEVSGKAYLCWQVALQPNGKADYWLVNVDAQKGTVLSKLNLNVVCDWTHPKNPYSGGADVLSKNTAAEDLNAPLVSGAKYRVVPFPAESPNHPGGTPAIKSNPWTLAGTGNNATTLQWNSDGTTTFDSSRGNNVLAQEDRNGNNGFGNGAKSTTALPNLTFTSKPNFTKPPTTSANQKWAITNLFYWNNIMHDISYQYGFDEVSGNFQANNLSRGGLGNDYVFADAQDGSGTNNANFATPVDGGNPRMQMFLFDAVPLFTVTQPTAFAGNKVATESAFSTANKISAKGPISGSCVLYNDDATGTTHQACGAAFNASSLVGKIAVIDRGTCNFTAKVKNAQTAGAIAAVVVDNIPGEYPFAMGGTDNTITIPAVMVSFETGDTIKQYLAASTAVNITLKSGVQIDGDVDNGVISHEYTHGISNRLTGGPNNTSCLGNKEQMGEGWSDYMALMVTTNWATATLADGPNKRPIGTYVLGQGTNGPGIRYYPYSTDFSVNPWTYDSMALSSRFSNSLLSYDPHVVGEVWCNTLWVMTWGIINQVGSINSNIYAASANAGNTIALRLVIEGMKLQPCSPGFVDGRDAILKADTILYGAAHAKAIWHAFASRGLGVNANEASTNNIKDGTADYTEPPTSFAKAVLVEDAIQNSVVNISPNPAKDKVNLFISGNTKQLSVQLINSTGQQLRTYTMNGGSLQMNVSGMKPGLYYIKIVGDGIAQTRKLVIE